MIMIVMNQLAFEYLVSKLVILLPSSFAIDFPDVSLLISFGKFLHFTFLLFIYGNQNFSQGRKISSQWIHMYRTINTLKHTCS